MIVTNCVITDIHRENDTALSMWICAPDIAKDARAGNFLHLLCGDGLYLRRPVSICDMDGDLIRVVFDVRGKGTAWLSGRRAGDVIDVLGPLGNAFPIDEFNGRILLVGGGVGVPPMLCCARAIAGDVRPDAVLGFRSAALIMLERDMTPLCGEVRVATDDGSAGFCGYAPACAAQMLDKKAYAAVFACGPKPLLAATAQLCAARNIPCYISLEERMGCGVGACLVCACKTAANNPDGYTYSHVCSDGPVFNAREVLFT